MKAKLFLALACAALMFLGAALGEEAWEDAYCYHLSPDCANMNDAGGATRVEAPSAGLAPCPACVPDGADYSEPEAWERGGTVVVRLPESAIARRMFGESVPGQAPDGLIHDGFRQDEDVARLVHGAAYLRVLEAASAGRVLDADALIPDLDEGAGALLMNRRHIGAAWYLVVRPEALPGDGMLTLPVRFYDVALEIAAWPAGLTLDQAEGTRVWRGELSVPVKKSGGEVVLRNRDDFASGNEYYAIRDDGVNICVIRESYPDPDLGLVRRTRFWGSRFSMAGYAEGKDAVYCCVLTDGELAAMKDKVFFPMDEAAFGEREGEPAGEGTLSADRAPATEAALSNGTLARLDAAEYPVGTPWVSAVFSRPGGGIAWQASAARLEKLSGGYWRQVGEGELMGRVNADERRARAHAFWFCSDTRVVFPMEDVGALDEGLYRLRVASEDAEGDVDAAWLEFRVRDGAPAPEDPTPIEPAPARFETPAHAAPHDDPAAYNSCLDTTRVRFASTRVRLLAGDTVFELRGVDESWGWGIGSHYSLFAWPLGRPGEAAQLIGDVDCLLEDPDDSAQDLLLYDLGDGLLMRDGDGRFYRCGYDGGDFRALGRAFPGEERSIRDALIVGRDAYLATEDGVWALALDSFEARRVYEAEKELLNSDDGSGYLVYDRGTLLVADGGIAAIDTTRRDGNGGMPARRLTDRYSRDSGQSGFGYIALGGRLYCWSDKEKATVSMELDGGDLQIVSRERFWFYQAAPDGTVLALTGTQQGLFGDERTAAALYHPRDPKNPTFDPDHCEITAIGEGEEVYLFGDEIIGGN